MSSPFFKDGECRNKVIELKYKTNGRSTVICKLVVCKCGNILAVHGDSAACGVVQAAKYSKKRTLSRTAGTEHNHKLSLIKSEIHAVKCFQLVVAACINSGYILKFYDSYNGSFYITVGID